MLNGPFGRRTAHAPHACRATGSSCYCVVPQPWWCGAVWCGVLCCAVLPWGCMAAHLAGQVCLFRGACVGTLLGSSKLLCGRLQLILNAGQLLVCIRQLAFSAFQLVFGGGQLGFGAGELGFSNGQLGFGAGQLGCSAGQLGFSAGQLGFGGGQLGCSAGQQYLGSIEIFDLGQCNLQVALASGQLAGAQRAEFFFARFQ